MMNSNFLAGYFLMFGMFLLILNFKHIINLLISLEIMLLSCIWLISNFMMNNGLPYWGFLVMLIIMVCESVLGIGLLIVVSRSHGGDMVMLLMSC